nr:hypothetical protein BaRGS_035243 [Batillaria attramentaria]
MAASEFEAFIELGKPSDMTSPVDCTREEKRATPDQIEFFKKSGHIPLSDGETFLPVSNIAVPETEVTNMPVKVLRDTGCSSVIVREDLVAEDQKLQEWTTLILADGTVRIIPLAKVNVSTPYLTGEVKALCVKTPVYDLIIGNVKGARDAEDPDPE